MPKNLNFLKRIETIDRCLKNPNEYWNWQRLAAACEPVIGKRPSRGTIMKDIRAMRSGELGYCAPIDWNKTTKSFSYADPRFSIRNALLKGPEVRALRHAMNILKQFKGFGQFETIGEIIFKLERSLNVSDDDARSVVHFDTNPHAKGLDYLDTIYKSIVSKQTLNIRYKPFYMDAPYLVTVSPCLLKEFNNRWFLLAFEHKEQRILNFALDRIKEISESIRDFQYAEEFKADQFFKNIIGVTLPEGETVQEVVIAATPEQARYIDTKPLHHTQKKISEDENAAVFSLQVIPNYELESLILSFGEKVKVLQPESLKNRIRERIENSFKKY